MKGWPILVHFCRSSCLENVRSLGAMVFADLRYKYAISHEIYIDKCPKITTDYLEFFCIIVHKMHNIHL